MVFSLPIDTHQAFKYLCYRGLRMYGVNPVELRGSLSLKSGMPGLIREECARKT